MKKVFLIVFLALVIIPSAAYAYEIKATLNYHKSDFTNAVFDTDLGYACVENTLVDNIPVFGLISPFNLFNMFFVEGSDYYKIDMIQNDREAKYIIPATWSGCESVGYRMRSLPRILSSYGSFLPYVNTTRVILSYPETDIEGDFSKSGRFSISMEKEEGKIIIRPR
ncbi:hypothetical protein ACFLQN_02465 [Candidatus Aenigmatarchaeota archaeon]